MRFHVTRWALGVMAALSLLGAANFAQASSLSQVQISAIVNLLQSFGADQSTINQVNQVLGGTSTPAPTSCVDVSRTLTLGSTGQDVTNLQNYLVAKGYLSATPTGYYGFLTAQAVGKLQLDLSIVSSVNDTAYGIMGPRTRTAVGCGSTNPDNATPSATIDQNSLTVNTNGKDATVVTLTGTAQNTDTIAVVFKGGPMQTVYAMVSTDGRWRAVIPNVYPNTYAVQIVDENTTGSKEQILTTGTLTVTGQALADLKVNGSDGPLTLMDNAPMTLTWSSVGSPTCYVTNVRLSPGAGNQTLDGLAPSGTRTVYAAIFNGIGNIALQCGQVSDQVNIYASQSQPSATIDQSSLTSNTGNPTITGTANNTSGVVLTFVDSSGAAYGYGVNRQASVVNGHWSLSAALGLSNGTYTVTVYTIENAGVTNVLTSSTLTVTAAQNLSPDGSTLLPNTNGSLTTSDGTWTFGSQSQGAGNAILLNGSLAANGWGVKLVVSHGILYTLNSFGQWWMWQSGNWHAATDPTATALSQCPQNTMSQRGQNGQVFRCMCPPNFSVNPVWGGPTYYTDDSDICTAGAQSGQMNSTSGGEVDYTIEPGQSSYSAWSSYNINSQSWGAWPGSFSITGPKG